MQDKNNTQYFKVEKEPEIKVKDVLDILCQEIRRISPAIIMQEV